MQCTSMNTIALFLYVLVAGLKMLQKQKSTIGQREVNSKGNCHNHLATKDVFLDSVQDL